MRVVFVWKVESTGERELGANQHAKLVDLSLESVTPLRGNFSAQCSNVRRKLRLGEGCWKWFLGIGKVRPFLVFLGNILMTLKISAAEIGHVFEKQSAKVS